MNLLIVVNSSEAARFDTKHEWDADDDKKE